MHGQRAAPPGAVLFPLKYSASGDNVRHGGTRAFTQDPQPVRSDGVGRGVRRPGHADSVRRGLRRCGECRAVRRAVLVRCRAVGLRALLPDSLPGTADESHRRSRRHPGGANGDDYPGNRLQRQPDHRAPVAAAGGDGCSPAPLGLGAALPRDRHRPGTRVRLHARRDQVDEQRLARGERRAARYAAAADQQGGAGDVSAAAVRGRLRRRAKARVVAGAGGGEARATPARSGADPLHVARPAARYRLPRFAAAAADAGQRRHRDS